MKRPMSPATEIAFDTMTDEPLPCEPSLAGTGTEQILGSLDRMRVTFRWKAEDLDADALAHRD